MQRPTWVGPVDRTWSLLLVGLVAATADCGTGNAPPFTPGTDGSTTSSGSGGSSGSSSSSGSSGSSGGSSGSSSSGGSSGSGSGGSSGSSSGSSSGGSSGSGVTTGVCAGAGTRVLLSTDTFIDDFEGAAISPGWSSFNDVGGDAGVPPPNSFKITQVAGGALMTAHAGRYTGTGARLSTAGGYGVGVVYNTAIDPVAGIYCINISAFDGVSFWAKAGTPNSKVSLNFVLPQTNMATTDPMTMKPNGGDCTTTCYRHPFVTVTLSTTWTQYTATFAAAAGGSAMVSNVIQELAWLSPDANWDFSLDEIAFYKGTPPAGPVGHGAADGGTPITDGAPGN